MVHRLQPTREPIPDIGLEPYRLSARMRKTSDDPVFSMKSVGQELRDERERKGKQLDDVWRALKIRPNYLAAIEEGRFEDLPGRAFTMGYVGRYARYLQLDVENLQGRLEAEIAAHDGVFSHRIDVKRLSDRKFPVLGIVIASLLLAALAYSGDDIISFATRALEPATEEDLKVVDAPVPAPIEQQTQVATPELLISLPFEVAAKEPVSPRPELLPPIPVIAVTRAVSLRAELLPPLPVIAVTRAVSLRPELLPPLPVIAVTRAISLRPELLPPLPVIAVTRAVSLRPELLPPLPVIAVTRAVSLRPELLPPIPVIVVTRAVSLRPELLPPLPVIAVTRAVSLPAELLPPLPVVAVTRAVSLPAEFLPPLPVIAVTQPVSLRAELLPQRVQAQLPPGRRYGLQNRDSRITLRVHRPTIVAIRDSRNRIFIDRRLAPGDTYRVPNLIGLWLTAIDASAVEIVLDGASVGFAGAQGAAVRDLSLNPQSIANRARRT